MRIMVCGVGGQGVILLSRMLCRAALRSGKKCISSEMHGMSRMLGSVNSIVKIGDYQSPEADKVDLLAGLDPEETERHMAMVEGEAVSFGSAKGATNLDAKPAFRNTFMLGVLCRRLGLDKEVCEQLIREFGKKVEENIDSFNEGYSYEA